MTEDAHKKDDGQKKGLHRDGSVSDAGKDSPMAARAASEGGKKDLGAKIEAARRDLAKPEAARKEAVQRSAVPVMPVKAPASLEACCPLVRSRTALAAVL